MKPILGIIGCCKTTSDMSTFDSHLLKKNMNWWGDKKT